MQNRYLPIENVLSLLKVSPDELKNLETLGKIQTHLGLNGVKTYSEEDLFKVLSEIKLEGQAGFISNGDVFSAQTSAHHIPSFSDNTPLDFVTISQAANGLGVSTKTVRRLIKAGKITPQARGKFGELYLRVEDVQGLKKHQGVGSSALQNVSEPGNQDISNPDSLNSFWGSKTQATQQNDNGKWQMDNGQSHIIDPNPTLTEHKKIVENIGKYEELRTALQGHLKTHISPLRILSATALSNFLIAALLVGAVVGAAKSGLLGKLLNGSPWGLTVNQIFSPDGQPGSSQTAISNDSYLSLSGGTITGPVTFLDSTTFEELALFNNGLEVIGNISGTSLTLSGGGVNVGGVGIIGTDGKIPALTSTYIGDLDGSEITNVDAKKLGGLERADFLRSNESDTAEGAINFTALPGGNGVGGGPVYINPGNATANYTLFGVAVNNQQQFKIDAEGDVFVNGGLYPQTDNAQDLGSATSQWKDLFLSGTINSASLNSSSLTLTGTNPIITFTDTTTGEDDWNVNVDGSSFYIRNTTDSSNYFSLSGAGLATFSNDLTVNGTFTANGPITLGNGDDAVTINGTTFSTTQTSPVTFNIADAIADAWDLQEGTRNYINVNTTNSSENVSFGNSSTNPTFNFLGTGSLGIASTTVTLSAATTLTASSLTLFTGGATAIDFTEFDVSATTGGVTINDTGDLGALLVEGTNLDINSLDFVGAGTVSAASGQILTLSTTSANIALTTTTSGSINLTTGTGTDLVNVLTGNLKVGNGTPGVTLDGEDAYIEGTFEVDGSSQFDGAVTFNGGQTYNSDVDFVFAGNENATITNTTNTLGASGMLDLASTGSTTDTRTLDLSTTFTSTGATTSYGLYNAWASSAVVTGAGVSQNGYGNYTTATKTGADDATGTYSLYGTYSTASNTGRTAVGTVNTYGGYFDATGDAAGTSNAYSLYLDTPSGADTNIGLYNAGTSTLVGDVTASGALTVGDGYGSTGVTITSAGNLSMDGDLTVGGTSTFSGNTFTSSNVTLGDAASDTITFVGVVNSNILPSASNTYNLGSSGTRWATGYFTTVDATTVVGVVAGGSTSSNSWTINSDNATANAEIDSLAFETGTNPINAVLQWNASGDATRYDSAGGNQNDVNLFNYPIGIYSQVSGASQTFTSGSLFKYYQDATHAITQSAAFIGTNLNFSSNITVPDSSSGNQTGALVTLKDGGASATAIGFQTAGTMDYGLDIGGTIGTAEIRLSNGETISNLVDGTLALTATTVTTSAALTVANALTVTAGGATITAGNLGIGTAQRPGAGLDLITTTTSNLAQYGAVITETGNSSATTSITGLFATATTAASAFTTTNLYSIYSGNTAKGAGSTITNQYGVYIEAPNQGTTSNIGLYNAGTTTLVGAVTNAGGITGGAGAFTTLTSSSTTTIGNGSGVITSLGNAGGAAAINLTSGTGSQTFTSSVVTGTTTTSAFVFAPTALTTGTGIYESSSTLSSGSLIDLAVTGTAGLTNQKGINVSLSGANATGAQTTYGGYFSNTHTGTSTNVGLYSTATGGSNNYAAIFEAGSVGIGTTTPTGVLEVRTGIDVDTTQPKFFSSSTSAGQYNEIMLGAAEANYRTSIIRYFNGQGTAASSRLSFFHYGASDSVGLNILGTGAVGAGTTGPDKALEVNSSTGANLRLTYNDPNGSAANYTDFSLSSTGALTLTGSAATLAASATAEKTFFTLTPATITLTAPTAVTSLMETAVITGATIAADAATTVNKATGLSLSAPIDSTNATITDSSALRILDISSGAGTLTNQYGIYIEAPTGGATTNIGLYNAGTTTLVGAVTFDGGITANTDTDYVFAGNENLTITNTTNTLGASGMLDLASTGSTTDTRTLDLSTTFTSTGATTSYGLYNRWASSAVVTGVGVSQAGAASQNAAIKTGADDATGTYSLYGSYNTASNTGSTDAGTKNTIGGYFDATGDTAGTTNAYGIYASALGADTNYGLKVAAMTGATSYGLDIGNMSGATANTGVNIGTLGTATTSKGINIGALSSATSTGIDIGNLTGATDKGLVIGTLAGTSANTGIQVGAISGTGTGLGLSIGALTTTGATDYGIKIGAISGDSATSQIGMEIGGISGTSASNYGISLGTLTGGTTSNYQITTGVLTSATTTTNAQLNLGGVVTTGGTTNYGIQVGALSGTGTTNYGINLANSTATGTNNYGMHVGTLTGAGTNNYGVYIEAPSGAATLNIGLYNAGTTTMAGNLTLSGDATRITKTYSAAAAAQPFLYVLQANAGGATGFGDALMRIDNRSSNDFLSFDNNGTNRFSITAAGAVSQASGLTIAAGGATITAGNLGVGVAQAASIGIRVNSTDLTTADQVGVYSDPIFTTAATTKGAGFLSSFRTAAATTMADGYGFLVDSPSIGATSAITNFYGVYVKNQNSALITNAYGVYIAAPTSAVTTNIGLYNAGTTELLGTTGIGGVPVTSQSLKVYGSITTGTSQYGIVSTPGFSSAATILGAANYSQVSTAASAFTMTNSYGNYIDTPSVGATSAITTNRGVYVANQGASGITNAYGVYIEVPSGAATTNIGLYNAGTTTLVGAITGSDLLIADGYGVVVGHSAQLTPAGVAAELQQIGTATADSSFAITSFQASTAGPNIFLTKSRAATVAVGTIVQSGDTLGALQWFGDDGTDLNTTAAQIRAEVDGTPGVNDMPGRILFSTTPDGSQSLSERMRINSSGEVIIGNGTTTDNANLTLGLTINQGANDDEILSLKSSDVAHGMTGTAETDTYGRFLKADAAAGGLQITGLGDSGATSYGVGIAGHIGGTTNSTKSTAGLGIIGLYGSQITGTGEDNVVADGNLVSIRGRTGGASATQWLVDIEGDTWQNGSITAVGGITAGAGSFTTLTSSSTTTIGNGSGVVTSIGNSGGAAAINLTTGTGAMTFASSVVSGTAFPFNAAALTTGTGFSLTANALTTGTLALLTSTSITTGKFVDINNGSSVFSVSNTDFTTSLPTNFTAAGDVSIAYDINFTNPTSSFIKSAAPITIQAGETFNSSNLTLKAFNNGQIVIDATSGLVVKDTTNGVQVVDVAATAERSGTARRSYQVSLRPEYDGGLMTPGAQDTPTAGNMTSDFCVNTVGSFSNVNNTAGTGCPTAGDIHNFYQWVSTDASTNYYSIWVRWQVPNDFSDWDTINHSGAYIRGYGYVTNTSNDDVTVDVYDTGGTIRASAVSIKGSAAAWSSLVNIMTATTGTWTPGGYVTIKIRMKSNTTADYTRVGEIELYYLSKFK